MQPARLVNLSRNYDTYIAVGDVHGMYRQFKSLTNEIVKICNELVEKGRAPVVVLLGDLIDRGPDSRKCVHLARNYPVPCIVVGGNHEDFMAEYRGGNSVWFADANGGGKTAQSYMEKPQYKEQFHRDKAWMQGLPTLVISDTYAFVHAGIEPKVSVLDQEEDKCRWIRDDFLKSTAEHDRYVVHGHSPEYRSANFLQNRCNLDTGSYYTGIVTAGVFHEGSPSESFFIRATGPSAKETHNSGKIVVKRYSLKMETEPTVLEYA